MRIAHVKINVFLRSNVTKLKNFVKYSVFILAIMTLVKYHNLTAAITVITDYTPQVTKTLYTNTNFCDNNQRYGYRAVS